MKRMKKSVNSCHDIASLRELRCMQHSNDVAKEAAVERMKSEVNELFSFDRWLVSLVQHNTPHALMHIVGLIFPFSKQ